MSQRYTSNPSKQPKQDKFVCYHCNKEVEPRLEFKVFSNKTRHLEARCPECGRHIKYVSQNSPPQFYFGKYKGKLIKDVNDLDYLTWVLENVQLKDNLSTAVSDRIAELC